MLKYDLSGKRFGSLVVVNRDITKSVAGATWWHCLCDCGQESVVSSYRLRVGRIKSCGCKRGDNVSRSNTTHGGYIGNRASPTLASWHSMIARCLWPSTPSYRVYGALGITVCQRWRLFANFLSDMGKRPLGTTLDRINGKKGYAPGNCRWSTPSEQSQNMRNNRYVSLNGDKMTIRQASDKYGLPYRQFRTHLYRRGSFNNAGKLFVMLPRAA